VQRKSDSPDTGRLAHGHALAQALRLDMSAWFAPSAGSYFGRVNKSLILAAIDEAKGSHAPALDKLKKAELAVRAEALVAGTGWLPEPLRIAAESAEASAEALPEAAE
jgi:ParB family chromosome partitioning protein